MRAMSGPVTDGRSLKFFRSLDGMVRVEGLFEAETGRIRRNAVDHFNFFKLFFISMQENKATQTDS